MQGKYNTYPNSLPLSAESSDLDKRREMLRRPLFHAAIQVNLAQRERSRDNATHAYLIGEVNSETVKNAIIDIDKANDNEACSEILLTMGTGGGSLLAAFALYDHVKASPKPVDILVEGWCMSAGVMILQAARTRIARPNTVFMIHPSSNKVDPQLIYGEFLPMAKQYEANQARFFQLSAERCGMSPAELERSFTAGSLRTYLTAEQALEFGTHGLIDEIREAGGGSSSVVRPS